MSVKINSSSVQTNGTRVKARENPAPEGGMHPCGCCPTRWNGLKTCHCAACHRTFTCITAFDLHRAGSHTAETRHCVDPAAVGLVDAGRAYECWGHPGRDRDDDEQVDA